MTRTTAPPVTAAEIGAVFQTMVDESLARWPQHGDTPEKVALRGFPLADVRLRVQTAHDLSQAGAKAACDNAVAEGVLERDGGGAYSRYVGGEAARASRERQAEEDRRRAAAVEALRAAGVPVKVEEHWGRERIVVPLDAAEALATRLGA